MKRSRADLFSYIGAPLNNVQWSWGAVREADGAVFLVVWQDEHLNREMRKYSLVHNETHWRDKTNTHGLNERKKHLERVRQGATTYMIMARVSDSHADGDTRRIEQLNCDEVFAAGELFEDEQGNIWLERISRIPVEMVRAAPPR
jgi:hypothetical protein